MKTKTLIVTLISLLIVGCGVEVVGGKSGPSNINPKEYCMRGVVYYSTGSWMATAWNTDGTLKLCPHNHQGE